VGLCGKVLVAAGRGGEVAIGVASVRNCKTLPLYLTEPMPSSSKMDMLLAKAKPISNGGSTSGIM